MFSTTKTYGHERGMSCAFRQWRAAHSHCSRLHGYAIAVEIEFECETLDKRNWVVDFGGLKGFEQELRNLFDHTTVVAEDDPLLNEFKAMDKLLMLDLRILPAVGCEAFANQVYQMAKQFIANYDTERQIRIHHVKIMEHGSNAATYKED